MRAVPVLISLILVALLVWGVVELILLINRRRSTQPTPTRVRWVFRHYIDGSETVVTASKVGRVKRRTKVLDEVVIDRISDEASDYQARFNRAEMEACERAAQLNRGGNLEQIRQDLDAGRHLHDE